MTSDFLAFPGRWEMNDLDHIVWRLTTSVCKLWSQKGGSWSWLYLFLLLSLIFEINKTRSLVASVTRWATGRCGPRCWRAELPWRRCTCGISLTPHFFSQHILILLPVVFFFPPPFSLFYFIFPRYFSLSYPGHFLVFPVYPSLSSLSLWLISCL